MERIYAYIGNWGMSKEPVPLGFSTASYAPETGTMEILQQCFPQIKAGSACLDEHRKILYCVNERPEVPGQTLGGQIYGLKIDPATGFLQEHTVSPSFGPMPSDCAIDLSGQYLLVSNHSSRNSIVKTIQDVDGKYHIVREYDETAIVLFPLDEEGRIGEPCDIVRHIGCGILPNQQSPHAHCVRRVPDMDLFIVCDKGNDSVYSYRIDTEEQRLVCCDRIDGIPGSSPRYCVFHPSKPYLYYNNETKPIVCQLAYDHYGKLTPVTQISCMETDDPNAKGMQADLRISADGKYLYTLVRDNSTIVVYSLDEKTGQPKHLQTVPCGSSKGGRWLSFSPDGNRLFLAACPDAQVRQFIVGADGTLTPQGIAAEDKVPAVIAFLTINTEE